MPRSKKTADTTEQTQPTKRSRKAKQQATEPVVQTSPQPEAPPQDPKLAAAEMELIDKYPLVNIVPGTLRSGGPEWHNKRVVTIRCSNCNAERTLATSDLFHVRYCIECSKQAKKEARKAKKES